MRHLRDGSTVLREAVSAALLHWLAVDPERPVRERDVLRAVFARLGEAASGVTVGPGDDAAVLEDGTVITTDTIVDGVHVDRRWSSMSDIGWKAVHAAVSDLPAMAAIGTGLVVSAQLPPGLDADEIGQLLDGIIEGAAVAGVPVVGGDVVTSRTLAVSVTATGRLVDPDRPLLRSGARVGDAVAVIGHLGRAAAGLGLLADADAGRSADASRELARHPELSLAHRRPRALVEVAPDLAAMGVTAGIDVSDGLGRDLGHVADASGVRILLEHLEPVDEGVAAAAEVLDVDWQQLVLGGDDYALAVTLDSSVVDALAAAVGVLGQPFRRVGEVAEGSGVLAHLASGLENVAEFGWEHA